LVTFTQKNRLLRGWLIEEAGMKYRNIFTGEIITTVRNDEATALYLSEIFTHFPVALMERST